MAHFSAAHFKVSCGSCDFCQTIKETIGLLFSDTNTVTQAICLLKQRSSISFAFYKLSNLAPQPRLNNLHLLAAIKLCQTHFAAKIKRFLQGHQSNVGARRSKG